MALRYKHLDSAGLRAEATARVMQWVLALVSGEKKTAVTISSSKFGHAACGGNEAVIFLMRAGKPTTGSKLQRRLRRSLRLKSQTR
jgi:hypothetical protein